MGNRESKYSPLLNIAAVIFSVISIYYTAEGFIIILGAETLIKELFAWGFAVGISCILLFCSLSVAKFISERKGIMLSLVFFAFALISLFFNINSIYGDFTSDKYIKDDIHNRSRALTTIEKRASFLTDSLYQVDRFKKTLDSLMLAAEREANDQFRPGKKEKWREIDVQIPRAQSNYRDALSKAQKVLIPLDLISTQFDKQKSIALINPTESSINILTELYNEYVTVLNPTEPIIKHPTLKFSNNSGDPAYTLKLLAKVLTFDTGVTTEEYSYIGLSTIIGAIIDFPIFFALVLLRWPNKNRKGEGGSAFSRIENRGKARKGRNGGTIKWD